MSNRAKGNAFEQELSDLLYAYGFWVHRLTQDSAGQPADVIAVRNKVAYLIDCKDCSAKGFDLRRVEENQINAMRLWDECGNGMGWFAVKVPTDEIYMISLYVLLAYKQTKSMLSFSEIASLGKPFEEWIRKCK